jgi:hypothetical protein
MSISDSIERPDWTLFASLSTLSQKAGVPTRLLRRLALKELADNALDAGGAVEVDEPSTGVYTIDDDGPGIDGSPERIARLFSIETFTLRAIGEITSIRLLANDRAGRKARRLCVMGPSRNGRDRL